MRADGSLRVWVKWCAPGVQTWVIGSYAVSAAGRVPVGRIITLGSGRQVHIAKLNKAIDQGYIVTGS